MDRDSEDRLNDNREIVVNTPTPAPVETDKTVPATAETESWLDDPYVKKHFTPEQIELVRGINPGNFHLKTFLGAFEKPQIDEKALRRNRTLGAIGDSMKLLGQMYGVHNGVRIERNDPDKTLTSYFAGKEDEARKLYQKRLEEWKRGYYGAGANDYKEAYNYRMHLDKQMRDGLMRQKELDRKQDWRKEDKETEAGRYRDTKKHQEDALQETIRSNKVREGIAWTQSNLKDSKENDFIYITPREDDANPDKKTHSDLGSVLPIPMTEKEIASYAASAVQDSTFVKNHPELFKKIKLKGLGDRETLE
ncbi:MAG: hypothetical protein LBF89_05585, partial [Bacteroidales bacterium]|nr:hypothetical protein [Bacteroidales bacterium]